MEVEGREHSLEVALWPPRLTLFITDCINSCTVTVLEDVTLLGPLSKLMLKNNIMLLSWTGTL